MRWILLFSSLLLVACDNGSFSTLFKKDLPLNPLTEINPKLAFTCAHETIPAASVEADVLFKYARWMQKDNLLKQDVAVDREVERLYRIASENGHYKANINLQNGAMRGKFQLDGKEHLRLSQQLITAGVATGYYFVARFLNQGAAGLKQDQEMALRYYRKAADEGSAEAQYYVGDKLNPIDIAPEIAYQMYRCASEQGHGRAAAILGATLKFDAYYREALEVLQLGVAAGNEVSSSLLWKGFLGTLAADDLYFLDQREDLERSKRYEKIWRVLANYSYANPKVPEINEIVPLPPAELPEWDGTLQWVEAFEANVPPPKPTETLIHELAKAQVLDPATGLPMPGSPAFPVSKFPLRICYSGNACPQTGYWKVMWPAHHSVMRSEVIRHFEEGAQMPLQTVKRYHPRIWPFADKITSREQRVEWGLLG